MESDGTKQLPTPHLPCLISAVAYGTNGLMRSVCFCYAAIMDSALSGTCRSDAVRSFLDRVVLVLAEALQAGDRADATAVERRDLEDIHETQQGDSDAYRRLIERYQDHVGRIVWRFSRDKNVHEELVQDVFVEAYMSLGTYRHRAPFANWLARIATRVGYRYWKQLAREKSHATFSLEEWDQVADDDAVERIDPDRAASILHGLLQLLAPRDRLVLTLRYLEQCDVAETARRTGWSKSMVKVQTLRARQKLRKIIEQSPRELSDELGTEI